MMRHCLDCDVLIFEDSRCRHCAKARARRNSSIGRQWRGSNWSRISERLRQNWRDSGFGCAHSHLGNCKGRIQADHLGKHGPYQPLCAYHNNLKGSLDG